MSFLQDLFKKWTCMHEWEEKKWFKLYYGEQIETNCKSIVYVYCCKKCGKFKKIRM